MPNILTTDDSTFIGGVGNWIIVSSNTALSTSSLQAPPGGGNALVLTEIGATPGPDGQTVRAQITRPHYPTVTGDEYSFSVEVKLDPANVVPPSGVRFTAQVTAYQSSGVGVVQASDAFVMSPGWQTLTIPSLTVTRTGSPLYIGLTLSFGFVTGVSPTGLKFGDKAYVANVDLTTPLVPVGGWGVGMVRMGAN